MTLLPTEREIPLSVDAVTLTTHRLRVVATRRGPFSITSIMLEELASCAAVKREIPLLLILALIVAGFGIVLSVFGQNVGPAGAVMGLLIGGLILLLYFASRSTVLVFASGGGSRIEVSTGHMEPEVIVDVIDTIEQAKDQRVKSLASISSSQSPPSSRSVGPGAAQGNHRAPSQTAPAVSRAPARGIVHYFYLDRYGQVAGPVTPGELKRLVDDGNIKADSQICAEGSEQWQSLRTVVAG